MVNILFINVIIFQDISHGIVVDFVFFFFPSANLLIRNLIHSGLCCSFLELNFFFLFNSNNNLNKKVNETRIITAKDMLVKERAEICGDDKIKTDF